MGTIISHTSHQRRVPGHRKAKKSYTLSVESVAFLESMRKRRKAGSVSSVLDEILQAVRRQQERASLEKAVADYYSSLSPQEIEEKIDWGEFAERQFRLSTSE